MLRTCVCFKPRLCRCLELEGFFGSMSPPFPATVHSGRASSKAHLFAQPFARGLGRRNVLFAPRRRRESSNSARSLAQKKAGTPKTPKRPTPKPSQTLISKSRKPGAYEPLTDKLAVGTSPTLLYRSSPNTDYLFGCYIVGGGLLAAALFNFQTQFYVRPGGVPRWVPVFTSVGSFMIACGGFWILLKVRWIARPRICTVKLTRILATEHDSSH